MSYNNPTGNAVGKTEHLNHGPVTNSLIFNSTSNYFKKSSNSPKFKYDEYGFKKNLFNRHQSEKELKKYEVTRTPPFLQNSQNFPKKQEQNHANKQILQYEHKPPKSNFCPKRNSNSKADEKLPVFNGTRGSGGKVNNALKQTSSTSSTEGLYTYKSQKLFSSFLRSQSRSPPKPKPQKQTLSKQRFRIIKRLGEGKFGNVLLAKQILSGVLVGLKVVEKKRILKQNFLGQFIRELKIQSFLDHPNIIKIYGYFSDENNIYIVMELGCDGQLFNVISNGQTLSEETTSFVIGNLLGAVEQMHQHKILHRDIKPENIVLIHGNIKLCDFGWAVNKKEQLRATFCGTPLYLSPQLLQGSKYDEKVDIWAIGILAYELYYGCSPFKINEQQDLLKIVTDQIDFPARKRISKQFKYFLQSILKKNPNERFSCKQLLHLQFIKKYRELQTCQQLCQ